ncbi:MAG: hypothetical protein ACYC0C_17555 [Devosia sp.]
MAIGAEIAPLGNNDTSDFWGGLRLAFDTLSRDLPDVAGEIHENFDLVVVGDSHLAARMPGSTSRAAVVVRVFLRFRDDDSEPIGLFVTYSEDAPTYPGQAPVAESVTVARGLMRIKYSLGETGEGAVPSPEAVRAIEAALRLRMVDRLA